MDFGLPIYTATSIGMQSYETHPASDHDDSVGVRYAVHTSAILNIY